MAATLNAKTSDEDALSPRETDVLRLTALGLTSAEIAGWLRLSTHTVESHRPTSEKHSAAKGDFPVFIGFSPPQVSAA